ncbi:hypothetical protein PoB_003315400 [Plakobranchus ocellatus]|uniref:Uncharacterized protein n=1 Tax=Plakobranchus ocellatus TaxID=259542 RepID=A0AAV4AG49_9GAST|nr:hypothetical protein PoB_003315400 [Plakobranchus ocellatus]
MTSSRHSTTAGNVGGTRKRESALRSARSILSPVRVLFRRLGRRGEKIKWGNCDVTPHGLHSAAATSQPVTQIRASIAKSMLSGGTAICGRKDLGTSLLSRESTAALAPKDGTWSRLKKKSVGVPPAILAFALDKRGVDHCLA